MTFPGVGGGQGFVAVPDSDKQHFILQVNICPVILQFITEKYFQTSELRNNYYCVIFLERWNWYKIHNSNFVKDFIQTILCKSIKIQSYSLDRYK